MQSRRGLRKITLVRKVVSTQVESGFSLLQFESWFSGYLAYEDEDEDDKDEEQDCVYWTVSGTNAT